ncbi:MAG: hypothetical protein PWQ84_1887, partial [Thermotogaceae bacterium]|nr:hypothetical protein [Thermotogaceae bacterium]
KLISTIKNYLDQIRNRFYSGRAGEHSYRSALESLLLELNPKIEVTNEPAGVSCGNPDFVITRRGVPLGYIETKDIDKNLDEKIYKEQFERYKKALDNLIITNYLDFRFYVHGVLINQINIGSLIAGKIDFSEEKLKDFISFMETFFAFSGPMIKSKKKLAEIMAAKAKLLEHILQNALEEDIKQEDFSTNLYSQYDAFKRHLIHDLTPKAFSDIYAQTLAYGMFAARLNDASVIPKSNPFLRNLFNNVAGIDIDSRIIPTVDNLAEFFNSTNRNIILKEYGHRTQNNDPLIHFYETFLAAYDKDLRTKRGVFYTPAPVVSFMVDSVDKILKDFFQIKKGLADASMTKKKVKIQRKDKRTADGHKYTEADHHRVQILDPATGTGTFLANIVDYIYTNNFKQNTGIWSNYVNEHLIPRLNGFELLMAPYSMAHLKVGLYLEETGYVSKNPKRLKIYLTNSMEEEHPSSGQLFANWLSNEANQASQVKRDTPIMCVIGNPPYSGESSNKSDWIMKLMEDYKKEPGETIKLDEKNPKWINDDYVKFIRYSQELIEKNGEGIIAFINNHSFLDNPTFRGMRWRLLKTFDKIFVLDLHGNSKKKEKCLDGSKDENVFDIQQGVSINFFIKTGEKKKDELGSVYHSEIYGKRNVKYDFLSTNNIKTVQYEEIKNIGPNYYFIPRDYTAKEKYDEGFSVNDLFLVSGVGMTTAHDDFVIDTNKNKLLSRFIDFKKAKRDASYLHKKFNVKFKKGWDILKGYDNIQQIASIDKLIKPVSYRPFDQRYILYEDKLVWRTARQVMQHFFKTENIGLIYRRQQVTNSCNYYFISKNIIADGLIRSDNKGSEKIAPLYLSKTRIEGKLGSCTREPNLNRQIVQRISDELGLGFIAEKEKSEKTYAPIDLLDYIYAILHSPTYREKYCDFLKTDFPKVPFPKDQGIFWKLVEYGKELRKLHLMEEIPEDLYNIGFPVQGDNIITKTFTKTNPGYEIEKENDTVGKVWINDNQYFSNVPKIAWDFFIGAYQPAQKWLKDRKGQKLSYDDIMHYQKIIVILCETDRIMREIDEIAIID